MMCPDPDERRGEAHPHTEARPSPDLVPPCPGRRVSLPDAVEELERVRRGGLWAYWRLRAEAWLEERVAQVLLRKLRVHQCVLAEQQRAQEARALLESTGLRGEREVEQRLLEWDQVRRQRAAGDAAPSMPPIPLTPPPPIEAHRTDEQIEAFALRGFLQGVETEEDWHSYKEELSGLLSPYAAEEVGCRLRELTRLSRHAQESR